jgi:tryptophan-rich hypothetical protein
VWGGLRHRREAGRRAPLRGSGATGAGVPAVGCRVDGSRLPDRRKHAAPATPRRRAARAVRIPSMNPVDPKKLLLSKWTAVKPVAREKHFVVTRVIEPAEPGGPVTFVEIEAVHSRRVRTIDWRELRDAGTWHQGWT